MKAFENDTLCDNKFENYVKDFVIAFVVHEILVVEIISSEKDYDVIKRM